MKNVITIVLDAFCYNSLRRKIGNKSVTPFLNELCKDSVSFSNMYSQAPYTEASLVSLLGGENVLENGGYLFENANVKNPVLKDYEDAGYHTILGYSPYIYSKSYLRNVTDYRYTRFYSILPCFDYRFSYFKSKKEKNEFKSEYYKICSIILGEAFETWKLQCSSLINGDETVEMLLPSIKDIAVFVDIKKQLESEENIFYSDTERYIDTLFLQWKDHKLIELNCIYNDREELNLLQSLKNDYNSKLKNYQLAYEQKVLKNLKIDFKYSLNTLLSNKDKKDFLRLVKSYLVFKKNKNLENYLNNLNKQSKCEVSIQKMFDCFRNLIKKYDENNENFVLYFQPQDFHLPSLFHTFDSDNEDVVRQEFKIAFDVLDSLDANYSGNIIADVSAHYCDFKIKEFYNKLKKELKNDFLFVVMADHGYPSYYDPPRPIIYNQTYTEAFHIPFIINDSTGKINFKNENELYSVLDGIEYVKELAGIKAKTDLTPRNFVVSEYAGPGCPMIPEKKIWYSVFSNDIKLSVELLLGKNVNYEDIKNFYDLTKDPLQKYNLRKRLRRHHCAAVDELLEKINERNSYLSTKFSENFVGKLIDSLSVNNQ